MKRIIRIAAVCLLLLVLPMAAFAEERELPLEYVTYGYGMPDPAGVPAHELTDQNVTLEDIRYETRHENGLVYIRLGDLAAAKLLRESEAKAKELGLDYEKLMISQGRPMARQDLTEQEQAEIQAKLQQLTASARVGVTTDDIFTLANAGEDKLQVRIAGFAAKPEEETPQASQAPQEQTRVVAKGCESPDSIYDEVPARKAATTIYVYYYGETNFEAPEMSPGANEKKEIVKWQGYELVVGIAYSQEDLDNGVEYYLTMDGSDFEDEQIVWDPEKNDYTDEVTRKAEDIANESVSSSDFEGKVFSAYQSGAEKLLPTIRISRDAEGNDVVKTIHMVDMTPDVQDIVAYKYGEYYIKDQDPDGYTLDRENSDYYNSTFLPDQMTTVELDPNDPSDVTIEVRDVLHVSARNNTMPSSMEGGEPVVMEQPAQEQAVESLPPQAEPEAPAAD